MALALSTQAGVQNRPFEAVITGQVAGQVLSVVHHLSSPGYYLVNDRLCNSGLPYPYSDVTIRSRAANGAVTDTIFEIVAQTRETLRALALATDASYASYSTTQTYNGAGYDYVLRVKGASGAVTAVPVGTAVVPVVPTFAQRTFTSLAGFGDSITAGSAATTTANRFINRVATNFSAALLNAGIGGTPIQNSPDKNGTPFVDNGRDRTGDILGTNKKAGLVIAYGVNDERYMAAPTTFNLANYINDYREVLNLAFIGGYTKNDICLVSPYWVASAYMTTNPNNSDFSGQTRSGADAYAAAVKALADEFGTYYGAGYEASTDQTAWVGADGLHPNDAGHLGYSQAVLAGTQSNTNAGVASVAASATGTAVTATVPAATGAVSYDYVLLLSGVIVATQAGVAGVSATFTGLAAGSYRVKARPNYSGVPSGPWAFTSTDAAVVTVVTISGTPGAASQNSAYNFTPTTSGGSGTKAFALTGTLPAGLTFSTTTGAISGTPTVIGTTSGLNITVTDTSGSASLGVFSLVVGAASGGGSILVTDNFDNATVGALLSTRAVTMAAGSANLSAVSSAKALKGPGAATSTDIASYGNAAVGSGLYAEADLIVKSTDSVGNMSTTLMLRSNNAAVASFSAILVRYNGVNISLQKFLNGTVTTLGTNYPYTTANDTVVKLRVEAGNGFQRVYLAGNVTPIISATDASVEADGLGTNYGVRFIVGSAGGGAKFSDTTGYHLDNLVFGSLA